MAENYLFFRRIAPVNEDGSVRGKLRVEDRVFPTIERGYLGVKPGSRPYTSVRQGVYTLVMTWKKRKKKSGKRKECLSFAHKGTRNLLIHAAHRDDPFFLEGCIAPGKNRTARGGIEESSEAMEELLELLGGFEKNKEKKTKYTIHVANNIPGVKGHRTQFLTSRAKALEARKKKEHRISQGRRRTIGRP